MLKEFSNKVVIVTGGTQGIGKATTLAFLNAHANVIANYYGNEQKAKELAAEAIPYQNNFRLYKADIAQDNEREKLIQFCLSEFNRIDVLVNNAAVMTRTPFLEITLEDTKRLVEINMLAPFFLIQRAAKQMMAQKSGGAIVNVSSVSAKKASGFAASYDMSKAGLSMLSKSVSKELAKFNIRVNTVLPGFTFTEHQQHRYQDMPKKLAERIAPIPLNRAGTPDDIAQAILFLASDAASYITGAELIVDGGWSSYLPLHY